jgi:hypothetical protein
MAGSLITDLPWGLFHLRIGRLIKLKVDCCHSASVIACNVVRITGILALGLVVADCCRYLHRVLFGMEKTMNNQETKCLPNPRFEADAQKRRAAQAFR